MVGGWLGRWLVGRHGRWHAFVHACVGRLDVVVKPSRGLLNRNVQRENALRRQ